MNEHSFVKSIHRKLPSNLYRWKIHDAFTGGVPDAMYAGPAGILLAHKKLVELIVNKDDATLGKEIRMGIEHYVRDGVQHEVDSNINN